MLDLLRRDGIALAPPLGKPKAVDIVRNLSGCAVWNAHVQAKATAPAIPFGVALEVVRWPMFCHSMADVVTAPWLLEHALGYFDLARDYFEGEAPRLYSMNGFCTQPSGAAPYLDTHGWHRDQDDRRQLVVFVLASDTDDAPHLYQRGTHRVGDQDLGRGVGEPPPDEVISIGGPAGTVFLADTGGLHMGMRPMTKPRLLLWARWGVSDPPISYGQDRLRPVPKELLGDRYPSDSVLREAIRLVVA